MNGFERFAALKERYPNAAESCLWHLTPKIEASPLRAEAFIEAWALVEDLATTIQDRVEGLASKYKRPASSSSSATFAEQGQGFANALKKNVVEAFESGARVTPDKISGLFGVVFNEVREYEAVVLKSIQRQIREGDYNDDSRPWAEKVGRGRSR